MSNVGTCPFFRDSANLSMGRGLGYCDLEGGQTICEGDFQCCNRLDVLRKQLLEQQKEIQKDEEDQETVSITYKVLVVDDEESIRRLIVALLSRQGHETITACNGVQALNEIFHTKCDAVIADIVMPEMDGITLTKKLLGLYPDLPVMVITGYTEDYSLESAIRAGARDFIKKPFSGGEFIVRFNKMMGDHEMILQMQGRLTEMFMRSQKTL